MQVTISGIRNIGGMTICLIWFQNKSSNLRKKFDHIQDERQ